MSIFVTNKDNFKVSIRYLEKPDGTIEILSEEKAEGEKSITLECRRPDFSAAQRILEASTDRSGTEQRLDIIKIKNNLLYFLSVDWDVVDEKGKKVECSIDSLSSLRLEIAKALSAKIEMHFGGINNVLPLF